VTLGRSRTESRLFDERPFNISFSPLDLWPDRLVVWETGEEMPDDGCETRPALGAFLSLWKLFFLLCSFSFVGGGVLITKAFSSESSESLRDCAREARSIRDKRSSRAVVDFGASSETVEGGRERTLFGDETEDGVRVLACSLLCVLLGMIAAPVQPAFRVSDAALVDSSAVCGCWRDRVDLVSLSVSLGAH